MLNTNYYYSRLSGFRQEDFFTFSLHKVSKGAKIRNRYNQVPHLTQDTSLSKTFDPGAEPFLVPGL